jgi:hypothetical protein
MLYLSGYRRRSRIAHHRQFLRSGPHIYPALPSVITHAAGSLVWHAIIININIVNGGGIDIGHRAVVPKMIAIPISAEIPAARVSIAVVDPAVISDVRTPVTRVPAIIAAIETPPRRSP